MPLLELDPSEQIPFEELTSKLCTRHFNIRNPSSTQSVVYRVRPTSKNFILQPKVGLLLPHQSAKIEVLLQPKNDKFRIVAAKFDEARHGGSSAEMTMLQDQQFWDDLEESKREVITEKRLKCIFTSSSPSSPSPAVAALGEDRKTENITGSLVREQDLEQARERIKKMETLIQSEKLAFFALENTAPTSPEEEEVTEEHKLTSGIIPKEMANPIFFGSPTAMFPPLLVFIILILAYLTGKLLL